MNRAPEGMGQSSSPALLKHFRVWVTVWVRRFCCLKFRTRKEKTGENLAIFTGLVELVAGLEPATC